MTRYAASVIIEATPDAVWALLTDAGSYPEWNSTIVSLEGEIALGNRISLVSTVNPKRAFRVTVSEMEAPHRMVWSDGMPLGLFKGVRTYTLKPTGGGTQFEMVEVFSGLLAPVITKAIPDMTESFNEFAASLKTAAEANS